MKNYFVSKTTVALAAVMAVATGPTSQLNAQPVPTAVETGALPANIPPGSPLADVLKMLQAGVSVDTIKNYVANSQSAFGLDADKIVFLKDEGAPSDLVNAMLDRDKVLYAAEVAPAPTPAPESTVVSAPETAPPPTEVTVNYFNDTLSPYGSWVEVEGYGRCWRPTAVIYDTGWRPYCDRGHWVYTDCGWYWDSDYSWGATFHYGRWFRHSRFGWCWYPDTVWAPSWVTWRSGGDYCGWAPLPPLAVYQPGAGFYYRGVNVAVGFDFGLDAGCFTFVSPEHFCERRPRDYCAPSHRVTQIFNQTTVINNYNYNDHNRTVVNGGISVERINNESHRHIEPVAVAQIPNAEHHGWRGDGRDRTTQPRTDNNSIRNSSAGITSTGSNPLRHDPAARTDQKNAANASQHSTTGAATTTQNQSYSHPGSTALDQRGLRLNNRDASGRDPNSHATSIQQPNHPQTATSAVGAIGSENQRPQIDRPHDNINHFQSQNNFRPPPQPQPQQFNTPGTIAPTSDWRHNRTEDSSAAARLHQLQQSSAPSVSGNTVQPTTGWQHHNLQTPATATPLQPPQTRQFNNSTAPSIYSAPQNNGWQNRNGGNTTVGTPPQHGAWQLEQHQPAAPSVSAQPPVLTRPSEPSQPRSYTAPAQSAPAPAQSQPRNSSNGQGSGRDKHDN